MFVQIYTIIFIKGHLRFKSSVFENLQLKNKM